MATTDSGAISSSCTIVDSSYETSSSSEGDVYLTKEVTPMNGVKLSYTLPYNSVGKNKSGLQHQQKQHKQHQHQYQQRQRQVQKKKSSKSEDSVGKNKVIGYLNLIANGIDNFAHGLAVAGSFMVSYKTGVLTTTAILIHEIPHEIGDFAILLKSGFTRWEAAWAQIYTAFIGLLGALLTLFLGTAEFMGCFQVYVLGFTAGAFLNIALVSVLPDLLQEERPFHSAAQLGSLLLGTLTMSSVALFC
ncbi:Zinc transporter ZIP13-like protein [Armadillidium vulgare]|nr:Zinc transporter ZIP13-like protein [Armadillidium vulgare]